MDAVLDLDPAAKCKIIIPEDHSYIISIKIKDNVTLAYAQFTGIWKLAVARDIFGVSVLKVFTAGNGFSISVDLFTLVVDVPTVYNLIGPGKYFYDLRSDEGGYSKHVLYGDFIVNPVIAKP